MAACNLRCATSGVVAVGVRLRLFSTVVDSVLSHGAEVWAVQLVTAGGPDAAPPAVLGAAHALSVDRDLHEIQAIAGRPGASKLAHYLAAA
jgi:hypothetical protein